MPDAKQAALKSYSRDFQHTTIRSTKELMLSSSGTGTSRYSSAYYIDAQTNQLAKITVYIVGPHINAEALPYRFGTMVPNTS